MNKKLIRLTEQDLHRIVKESVSKLINEIGDTPKGQRALGALGMRHALRNPKYDARDTKSKEAKIHKYAEKARGGDTYNYKGTPQNPMWYDFANGAVDYMNSHTDELAAAHRRAGIGENRMLREWEDGFDTTIDDDDNVYYGNYSYKTNSFKKSGTYWILEGESGSIGLFLDPKEAALYAIALDQDYNIEMDINEEEELKKIMYSLEEQGDSWQYKGYRNKYYCNKVDLFKQKQ